MDMVKTDAHGREIITMVGRAGVIVIIADQQANYEADGYKIMAEMPKKKVAKKKATKSEE
jgi:hypothetical protein